MQEIIVNLGTVAIRMDCSGNLSCLFSCLFCHPKVISLPYGHPNSLSRINSLCIVCYLKSYLASFIPLILVVCL